MEMVWFSPVCDHVLAKVNMWYKTYEHGEVFATKSYMYVNEERHIAKVIDRPTIYAHKIAFTRLQMDHFIRILKKVMPDSPATKDMIKVSEGLKKGILIPPNGYVITLAFYPEQVKEMLDALNAAKNGTFVKIDDIISNQEEKAPFEI